MNNLRLQVLLSAIDKATAPLRSVAKRSQEMADKLKESNKALRELEKTQNKMGSFSRISEQAKKSSESIDKHTQKLKDLKIATEAMKNQRIDLKVQINEKKRELSRLEQNGNFTARRLQVDFDIRKLETEYEKLNGKISKTNTTLRKEESLLKNSRTEKAKQLLQLRELKRQLKATGVDVKQFDHHQANLAEQIHKANTAIDQQKAKLERLSRAAKRQEKYRTNVEKIRGASERLEHFGQRAMTTGLSVAAPTLAMGKGVIGMAKTAGKFEQYLSVLEVTEGSAEKAKESFAWVQKYAQDTPSNLDEATEAFVKLRAYGLDPTNGLLMTLGDTGAAMGKNVMQAVEAIADAVTGENERLKEFGVKGSAIKGKNIIEYAYTDKNGKQQVAKVDKNNRKQIEQTLTRIFNEKYAGAMEKQSKTLMGVWAKIEDVWTNLQMRIMQTGTFDWIKNKLQGVLDTLDKMDKNGELQKWAEDIGAVILEVAKGLWEFGEKVLDVINIVAKFAREHKGAIASMIKWSAIIGTSLVAFGALNMIMSFALYPVARLIYGFTNLIGVNRLLSKETLKSTAELIQNNKHLFSAKTTLLGLNNAKKATVSNFIRFQGVLKNSPTYFKGLIKNIFTVKFWLNKLGSVARVLMSPFRLLFSGILSSLSLLFSPIGLLAAMFIGAGVAIYKYWDKIKAFFGGFWDGLKEKLAPVIEKFKPLGDLLGVVVGWVEKAWKWFTDLFTPVETTQKGLDEAASAGKKFGEWLAAGIDLVTKPLQWLMDKIAWVKGQMPEMEESAKRVNGNIAASATKATEIATMIVPPQVQTQVKAVQDKTLPTKGHARGGFTGAGGKYDPAGIVHRGEYVMTKEATARLGVTNLNRLNYGGVGGLAAVAAMASGVALAQPMAVKVDNRPLLSAPAPKAASGGLSQNISITINASPNQSEREIARLVQRELAKAQHQAQARNRSSLRDRG